MTFPTVAYSAGQAFSSNTTQHLVEMPATVYEDDLLIVCFATTDVPTFTTPSGWTYKLGGVSGSYVRFNIYAKKANGTEGGTTVDFVTSTAETAAAHVYRIEGWYGNLSTSIEGTSRVQTSSDNSAEFNGETVSWGAEDNLWFGLAGAGDDGYGFSSYSAGFSGGESTVSKREDNNAASIGACWLQRLAGYLLAI